MPVEIYHSAPDVEQDATERFPQDQFVRVPAVCLFAEHETLDSHGQPQRYDRDALEKIVACCNERILETGDYAPLTIGHTPDDDESDRDPEVVGFVGNFRLGRIGRKRPKYAIFADEWHFKDKHDQLRARPRRSVEVWMDKDMGKRFFDPVAALGAETPRLDLGIKFRRDQRSGQLVEKYAAAMGAAVAPGSGNVFVPDFGDEDEDEECYEMPSEGISPEKAKKILADGQVHGKELTEKQKGMFGAAAGRADDYQAPETGARAMLSDDELRQILDAINQMDFVQWVRGQMSSEQPDEPEGEYQAPPEDNGGELEESPPVPADAGEIPPAQTLPPPPPPAAETNNQSPPEAGPPPELEEEDEEQYSAMSTTNNSAEGEVVKMSRVERQAEREKHRKMESAYGQLQKEHYALKKRYNDVVRRACDSVRNAKIEELGVKYAIDPEEEKDRCLYARGSNLTNEAFDLHVQTIERLAQPSPVGHSVPRGVTVQQSDKKEQEKYERARAHAEASRKAGNYIDWETALAAVESGNGCS